MLVYVYAHLWTWGMCICGVFRKQNPLPSQNTNSWTFHESSDWPVTRHQPSGNGNGYDNIRMSNNTVCQGCQVTLWPKSTQAEIHYMDYLREREYGRARKQLYVCVCVCVCVRMYASECILLLNTLCIFLAKMISAFRGHWLRPNHCLPQRKCRLPKTTCT